MGASKFSPRAGCGILVGLLLLSLPANSEGETAVNSSLVGRTVMTIRDGVEIKRDEQLIVRCNVASPIVVTEEDGQRVRCKFGWLSRNDVLPADDAIRMFTKLVEKNPSADHYYQRARAYFGQDEIALSLLDVADCLATQPANAKALALRGQCWVRKERYQQAIDDFDEAIAINAQEPRFYVARAFAMARLDSDQRALADFEAAIRCDPCYYQAYLGRAMCLYNVGRLPEAIEDLTVYVKHIPDDPDGYFARAECYFLAKQLKNAVDDLTTCICLEPKVAGHYVLRGHAFVISKHYPKAIADFRVALRLSPENAKLHYTLGSVLIRNSEFDEGLTELNKALELDPNLADAYLIRAMYWLERKDYRKGLVDASLAADKAPEMAQSHLLRAMILGCAFDPAIRNGIEAVKAAEKACKLTEYKDADCLQCLAAGHAEAGDFDEAIRWQKKAIEINKDIGKALGLEEALRLFDQKKPLRTE